MTPRAVSLLLVSALLVLSTGAYVAHSVRDARLRSTGAYAVAMKRVSLDANQGGGLANPSKSKKQRRSNYGTNQGGGENRARW